LSLPTVAKLLFRPEVLQPHLASFHLPERVAALRLKIAQWAEMFASGRAEAFKERELLPQFINDFFFGLLGYTGSAPFRLCDWLIDCNPSGAPPPRDGPLSSTASFHIWSAMRPS